jgi:hypothetical protein
MMEPADRMGIRKGQTVDIRAKKTDLNPLHLARLALLHTARAVPKPVRRVVLALVRQLDCPAAIQTVYERRALHVGQGVCAQLHLPQFLLRRSCRGRRCALSIADGPEVRRESVQGGGFSQRLYVCTKDGIGIFKD